jgi:hypothetical protein
MAMAIAQSISGLFFATVELGDVDHNGISWLLQT